MRWKPGIFFLLGVLLFALLVGGVSAIDTDGDGVDDEDDWCPTLAGSPDAHGCLIFRIVILAFNYDDHGDFLERAERAKTVLEENTPFRGCEFSLDVVILDPNVYECDTMSTNPYWRCKGYLEETYGYDWTILTLMDESMECNSYSSNDYPVILIHKGMPASMDDSLVPHELGHQMYLCDEYREYTYDSQDLRYPGGCRNSYPGDTEDGLGSGTASGGTCDTYDGGECDGQACCGRDLDGAVGTKDVCIMGGGGGLYRETIHPPGEGYCTGSYTNPLRFDDECEEAFIGELNARGVWCEKEPMVLTNIPLPRYWLMAEMMIPYPPEISPELPIPRPVRERLVPGKGGDPGIFHTFLWNNPKGEFGVIVRDSHGKAMYSALRFAPTFLSYDFFGAELMKKGSLVSLNVPLPRDADLVEVSYKGEDLYSIDVSCPYRTPLPGYELLPGDPDRDDLFEDTNANQLLDYDDAVTLFWNVNWISRNEPVPCFDINGNGIMDYDDAVTLFWQI